jgi:DNA-binding beta-propeller fold protein YncE
MKTLLCVLTLLILLSVEGLGATLFLGAYPDSIIIFDEGKGQIVDRIPLTTGLPTSMRLSQDRKTIYVTTNDHSGIEVIDVATRNVINHFELNTTTKRYRFNSGVPDPAGKFFYTVTTEMNKLNDRYEIGKPKYTVIDLMEQKIVKTFDIAREDENANGGGGGGRNGFEISPDGKYLYQFRDKVVILNTDDFKVADRIELAKPDLPGMENVGFGGLLDSISEPGKHISLFNSADPIVHNRVFGIARFDLTTRQVNFTPIGPAPQGMAGLQVAPDKNTAYTVTANGAPSNKRCEFWAFDLGTNHITQTAEVPCRSRFSFGMAGDGKKLYFYGAGFEIEVYDAATLKYERTWDLNNDVTGAGMIIIN